MSARAMPSNVFAYSISIIATLRRLRDLHIHLGFLRLFLSLSKRFILPFRFLRLARFLPCLFLSFQRHSTLITLLHRLKLIRENASGLFTVVISGTLALKFYD